MWGNIRLSDAGKGVAAGSVPLSAIMHLLANNEKSLTDSRNAARSPERDERLAKWRVPYSRLAWIALGINILIILIGTVVRATNSGDGCGSHWPLCNGEANPLLSNDPQLKTIIEFTHRITSAIDGPLILTLLIGAFVLFPRGASIRKAAVCTFVLTGVEAFIGAYLVKKGLVATNTSITRAVWLSLHLVNTFFLLASLTATAWFASGGEKLKFRGQGSVGASLIFGIFALILLGVSGAVTALGDTLFPVKDHADALQQAATGTHFLQQLRLWHPYIAGSVGLYLILIGGLVAYFRPTNYTRQFAQWLGYIFLTEIAAGFVNVLLRAPVPMQVIHLLLADFTWISLILLSLAGLAQNAPQREVQALAFADPMQRPVLEKATLGDYIALTKPRVISLLLFTSLTAMVIAAGGWPRWIPFIAVAIGGYLSVASAKVLNMALDYDLDRRMSRTADRPTATGKISIGTALTYGLALGIGSFVVLWLGANLLSAMLALAGLVFYVIVYTLFLKRRTWHNIVIGGAAGAFPPLVGWAAVTGDLSGSLAWYLFAIIFLWTPAHFWALALLLKDDYREADVPMLPVVLGDRATVTQIVLYAILTAIISLVPLAQGLVGPIYIVCAILLNVVLLVCCAQLFVRTDRPHASRAFHYSMLYLALLFLAMAIDRSIKL
jgi:protoheme IX farnesyltransferase